MVDRRPIPSASGYFADANGHVYASCGRRLSASVVRGYLRVSIKRKSRYVSRLVCEAFHGPKPTLIHQAAHNDGVRTNNRPDNLRWATPQENSDDKKLHGTELRGERNGNARLTSANVLEIRAIYAASMGHRYVKRGTRENLAARFSVGISAIKDIVAGRSWPHATIDIPFLLPEGAGRIA